MRFRGGARDAVLPWITLGERINKQLYELLRQELPEVCGRCSLLVECLLLVLRQFITLILHIMDSRSALLRRHPRAVTAYRILV